MRSLDTKTLPYLLAWLLLLVAGMSTAVDLDVWHGMALAREMVRLGAMPLDDQFAYTPTIHPSVHHEWGSGMVLYLLATSGGLVALQALRLALIGVMVFGALRAARRGGASTPALVLLGPLAAMMMWIGLTAVRSQMFTLAFLAVWLAWLADDRTGRRGWVWGALATLLLWQNVHAGFVVGIGFVGIHGFEQLMRGRPIGHLVALVAAAAVLLLATPYGWLYYPQLVHGLTMPRPMIGEWHPIWQANPVAFGLWSIAVVVALVVLLRCGPRRAHGWPLLLTAIVLSAQHERHVSIFTLVWFVTISAWLPHTAFGRLLERAWDSPWHLPAKAAAWSTLAMCLAVAVSKHPWRLTVPGTTAAGGIEPYPVGAVDYLERQHVQANMLVPFAVGAFVSWKLHPAVKVSFDSRYEAAFPPERLDEHVVFYEAEPGWKDVLERWPTDLVLAGRGDKIADVLAVQTDWAPVYRDDAFVLYARPGLALPHEDRTGTDLVGTFP
jgi:hypothetical protein